MSRRMMTMGAVVALGTLISVAGCDSGGDGGGAEPAAEPFELIGEWATDFGDITVTASEWIESWGTLSILGYDNDENSLYMAGDDGAVSANAYTDADADGALYYCTYAFGLATLEDAMSAEDTSDASDPGSAGCGAFAWTKMSPKE